MESCDSSLKECYENCPLPTNNNWGTEQSYKNDISTCFKSHSDCILQERKRLPAFDSESCDTALKECYEKCPEPQDDWIPNPYACAGSQTECSQYSQYGFWQVNPFHFNCTATCRYRQTSCMVDVLKSRIALAISPIGLTETPVTQVLSAVPMFRLENDDFTQTDAATAGSRCRFKQKCAGVYASKDYKKFYLATEDDRDAQSLLTPIKAEEYGAFYKYNRMEAVPHQASAQAQAQANAQIRAQIQAHAHAPAHDQAQGCITPQGVYVTPSVKNADGTIKQGKFPFKCEDGYKITGTGLYYSSLTCKADGSVTYPLERSCVSALPHPATVVPPITNPDGVPAQPKQSARTDYAVPPPLGTATLAEIMASHAIHGYSPPNTPARPEPEVLDTNTAAAIGSAIGQINWNNELSGLSRLKATPPAATSSESSPYIFDFGTLKSVCPTSLKWEESKGQCLAPCKSPLTTNRTKATDYGGPGWCIEDDCTDGFYKWTVVSLKPGGQLFNGEGVAVPPNMSTAKVCYPNDAVLTCPSGKTFDRLSLYCSDQPVPKKNDWGVFIPV